jgi:glycosyltransferase involved in cell wall biosynthesis
MSCGIPVVGFNTGGIPDMIVEGVTGYLAETGNIQSLAAAIEKVILMKREDYKLMADNCRVQVIGGFTLSHQADSYLKLYNQLI